jgi:LytS/YehU family sensor histidine kinase
VTGYTSNVVLTLFIVISLTPMAIRFLPGPVFWTGFDPDDADIAWKAFILLLVILFIYNVIYALLYAYQHYAVAQLEHLQQERKQLELQFEALKSQISPHYLFNSLNTISSLLFKDVQSAEQFIRRLVQTYQYILATQDKKYVLLREELDFVQSYYYLLRIRFQHQLHVEINVPAGILNTKIPPLTLQMLVENAVKHNAPATDSRLFIYISAQDNTYLKVANTKTGLSDHIDSFKVGLENIRNRYRYFTDKQILVKNDDKFMVSLPLIELRGETEHKHSA